MEVRSAVDFINDSISYKPEWKIEAESGVNRFEGTIVVKFTFPAYHTERDLAREGYPSHTNESWAKFRIIVGDCDSPEDVCQRILEKIIDIEAHEAREYLRVKPTYWAPFHPHRIDGMKRYGQLDADLAYGVV